MLITDMILWQVIGCWFTWRAEAWSSSFRAFLFHSSFSFLCFSSSAEYMAFSSVGEMQIKVLLKVIKKGIAGYTNCKVLWGKHSFKYSRITDTLILLESGLNSKDLFEALKLALLELL